MRPRRATRCSASRATRWACGGWCRGTSSTIRRRATCCASSASGAIGTEKRLCLARGRRGRLRDARTRFRAEEPANVDAPPDRSPPRRPFSRWRRIDFARETADRPSHVRYPPARPPPPFPRGIARRRARRGARAAGRVRPAGGDAEGGGGADRADARQSAPPFRLGRGAAARADRADGGVHHRDDPRRRVPPARRRARPARSRRPDVRRVRHGRRRRAGELDDPVGQRGRARPDPEGDPRPGRRTARGPCDDELPIAGRDAAAGADGAGRRAVRRADGARARPAARAGARVGAMRR